MIIWPSNLAQWAEPETQRHGQGEVVYTSNPSIQEDHDFQASQKYTLEPYLKTLNKTNLYTHIYGSIVLNNPKV